MKKANLNRLLVTTALAAALATLSYAPVAALPVLFGVATVEGTSGEVTDIQPGQTVTATEMLQLVAPDGSIITVEPGSVFTLTGEGDNISFELVSGAMRVASSGTPISITRGGVTITTAGGAFSAFEGEGGGLEGRVNQGVATVETGSETREFAKGEGYVATETSIAGTFTPPVVNTTQMAQGGLDDDADYSPADEQGSEGSEIVEEAAGGGSGGGYGGTPPVTGVIVPVTGDEDTGYVVAYAADAIGIDLRAPAKVTIGPNGELNEYDVEPDYEERLERNSNQSLERGNSNNVVFIERWAGGETNGNYYNGNNGTTYSSMGRTSHQGFHLAYAKPTVDLLASGIATYTLAAATNPTIDNGQFAPGTFTGEMSVLFGANIGVGVDFEVDMPGDFVYSIRTPGGTGSPTTGGIYWDAASRSFRINNISMAQGGAACPTSGCTAVVYGILAGTEASDIGISYQIMDFSVPYDDLFRAGRISGAAAFAQASYDAGAGPIVPDPVESGAIDAMLVASPAATKWYGSVFYNPAINFQTGKNLGMQNDQVAWDEHGVVTHITATETSLATYDRGTAVTAELYGTEYMQIGRWNGGDVDVYLGGSDRAFSPHGEQGLIYLVGSMLGSTSRPESITATYDLAGATGALFTGGNFAPGLFSGTAAIEFGVYGANAKMGLDATVTMDEGGDIVVYNISTPGGTANPGISEIDLFGSQINGYYQVQSPTGAACSGSAVNCNVNLNGFIGGPGAREAGINYLIGNNMANAIYGAAIFSRNDAPELDNILLGMTYRLRSPSNAVLASSVGDSGALATSITIENNEVKLIDGGINSTFEPGATTVSEVGGVTSVMAWQRWSDGQIGGQSFGNPRATLGQDQSMHVLAWSPASNMPTEGTASYSLVGATNPTVADGSVAPGSFDGAMAVSFGFGTTKIGLDLDVSIGGHTYNVATSGGVVTPSSSQIGLGNFAAFDGTLDVAAGGVACAGVTCQAKISGGFAGSGASHAALAYTISDNGNPTAKAVQGVAGFERGPIVVGP